MLYHTIRIGKLKRNLPIVSLGPKIKIASFNLLGDTKLVNLLALILKNKLKGVEFDYFVGPEVKVVPLLQQISSLLKKDRYIICRKNIHGYMVGPIKTRCKPHLVLDGNDTIALKGKRIVIVDDVVTSGKTIAAVEELMEKAGSQVVEKFAIFKQGERLSQSQKDIVFLDTLPIFHS